MTLVFISGTRILLVGDSVRLLAVIGLYQWDQDSSHWSLSVGPGFCDSVRLLDDIGLYQWYQDSSRGGFCDITGCHWSLSVGPGFFSWGTL